MTTSVEPARRVSRGWAGRFGLVWLGVWIATLVPIQLALPDQLDVVDHAHRYRDFGVINALVGIVSLVTLPLFGALCDRTESRFGRRKIWVLGGILVMAIGLILTGQQHSWGLIAFFWCVVSLGYNAMAAGLTSTVADEVPDEQRGVISGFMFGTQGIGIVVGLLAVQGLHTGARYAVLAVAVLLFAVPFLVKYRDVSISASAPALTIRGVLAGMWVNPRANPDFGWAFGSRLMVNIGNALAVTYLWFFLRDGLKVDDPDSTLLTLTLIYLVATLSATFLSSPLSDRTGRRRIFVGVAAMLQAAAGILVAITPSVGTTMIAAALLGAGFGAFVAVDQALVTAVLPSAADRAKDLGILNVGSAVPQGVGPLVAAGVVAVASFSVLFLAAGIATTIGALMISRVRSVR